MRIAIAARDLGYQSHGPASYTYGLIHGLLQVNRGHEIHVYYSTSKAMGLFPSAREHYIPIRNRMFWDHWQLPLALKRDRMDCTIFPKGTLPFWFPGKALAIMLDMGYFYPEIDAYKTLETIYMRIALRLAARRAWGIFTISEATRRDVIHLLDAPEEKTLNIYGACHQDYQPCVDEQLLSRARQKYNLREPFIFYPASSISPRKNFLRLFDAFESIQQDIPHHLYITGGATWKSAEALARLEGHARIHRLGSVPFEDMAALYTLAEFTIYPSIFEGLGIPALEAFQCGSPVMTTTQTSLPEVAGDAALLVDGYDVNALARGMQTLAGSSALRDAYRQKGFVQAKKFSWEITAQKALDWMDAHA
jgi:glycosyltransferase involved in cell wall biosynthesis